MARVEKMENIAPSEVDQTVLDYESEGATVTKTDQGDGKWTVTATWPDEE